MSTGKKGIDEERIASASYVLNFYQDVSFLTHHYCNYENILTELELEIGSGFDKLEVEQKDLLKNYCSTLRYYARATYIRYMSIMAGINSKPDEHVREMLEIINSNYIIERKHIEEFVLAMNRIIIDTVIKSLLENSNNIVNQLYGGETESG